MTSNNITKNNTRINAQVAQGNATPPRRRSSLSPTVRTSNRINDVLSTSVPRTHFFMNTQDVVPLQNLSTLVSRPVARVIERNSDNRSAYQAPMPRRRESLSDKVKTD